MLWFILMKKLLKTTKGWNHNVGNASLAMQGGANT
jgi:hypothetical protein